MADNPSSPSGGSTASATSPTFAAGVRSWRPQTEGKASIDYSFDAVVPAAGVRTGMTPRNLTTYGSTGASNVLGVSSWFSPPR
jgi:hypothetical protein